MKPPVDAPTSSARRPSTRDLQRVERVGELDAAARDVRRRAVDLELDLGIDQLARFLGAPPAGTEVHLTGDHGRRGARARFEQPALREQGVQADAGHGVKRYSSASPNRPMRL